MSFTIRPDGTLLETWLSASVHPRPTATPFYHHEDAWWWPQASRWLMAHVCERLGRPDSATICLELMLAPLGRHRDVWNNRGIWFSFAHRRLVLLHARLGKLEDAHRHWTSAQR